MLNYLSGIYWPSKNFGEFWPPDVQLMAKDILRIHSTIWPAMLLALDIKLPKKLFAHGFFTVNGKKMSKSLKNIVDPNELVKNFGADAVRYFLLREFAFGQDGDFSMERFVERYNADLANDLGNLLQRVLKMVRKYKIKIKNTGIPKTLQGIEKNIENLEFKEALDKIWDIIISLNQKIDKEKPWEIVKKEPKKLERFLNELIEQIQVLGNTLAPILPETSQKISEQIKTQKPEPLFPKKSK